MKLIYCLALTLLFLNSTHAQSPREILNQYVAELKNTPGDDSLRKKIILIAHRINPQLAVPDEAERFLVRGKTAAELAKDSSGYADAITEFENATMAAPWLGKAYFNLAVVQESAKDYNSAIKNYSFYRLAEPNAPDANDVKTKIYELEFKRDKAEKDKQTQAQAAAIEEQKKRDYYDKMGFLAGTWNYLQTFSGGPFDGRTSRGQIIISISGKTILMSGGLKGTIEGDDYTSIKWVLQTNSKSPDPNERMLPDCPINVTIDKYNHKIHWEQPSPEVSNPPVWRWDLLNVFLLSQ